MICNRHRRETGCHLLAIDKCNRFIIRQYTSFGAMVQKILNISGDCLVL